eukprot:7277908-Pyramimonas_sp.AAC.1
MQSQTPEQLVGMRSKPHMSPTASLTAFTTADKHSPKLMSTFTTVSTTHVYTYSTASVKHDHTQLVTQLTVHTTTSTTVSTTSTTTLHQRRRRLPPQNSSS